MVLRRKVAAAELACADALAAAWTLAETRSARAQEPRVLHSTLPTWPAPGTFLRLRGRTAPGTTVELWIAGRAIANPAGAVSTPIDGVRPRHG